MEKKVETTNPREIHHKKGKTADPRMTKKLKSGDLRNFIILSHASHIVLPNCSVLNVTRHARRYWNYL